MISLPVHLVFLLCSLCPPFYRHNGLLAYSRSHQLYKVCHLPLILSHHSLNRDFSKIVIRQLLSNQSILNLDGLPYEQN